MTLEKSVGKICDIMGSGYTRDTVKTCDFSAILGGRVIREIGLYASMYGNHFITPGCAVEPGFCKAIWHHE